MNGRSATVIDVSNQLSTGRVGVVLDGPAKPSQQSTEVSIKIGNFVRSEDDYDSPSCSDGSDGHYSVDTITWALSLDMCDTR